MDHTQESPRGGTTGVSPRQVGPPHPEDAMRAGQQRNPSRAGPWIPLRSATPAPRECHWDRTCPLDESQVGSSSGLETRTRNRSHLLPKGTPIYRSPIDECPVAVLHCRPVPLPSCPQPTVSRPPFPMIGNRHLLATAKPVCRISGGFPSMQPPSTPTTSGPCVSAGSGEWSSLLG
jgi:hypothetical protein